MRVRSFAAVGAFLLGLGPLTGWLLGKPGGGIPATRRHVLLLTVDTLRADYLSGNGYDRPTSPFIDSLLARGVSFTHAVTTVPRTTPALASLLTGTYPQVTGVRRLVDGLRPGVTSLAELAKKQGYATLAVVSNDVLVPQRGLNRGFDTYDVFYSSRNAAATTAAALRHLQAYRPEDAVFAWVHYIDPHMPYEPPPHLAREFDPGYDGPYQLNFGRTVHGVTAYPEDLPKAKAVYQNTLPPEVNAHIRRLYAAEIRSVDDHIAQLVAGFRATLGDDWLIVFTADHGENLGKHDYFFEHGDYVYNPAIRIPLAFLLPDTDPLHRSAVFSDPVSIVDVTPTLVDLLGLSSPVQAHLLSGRSLAPYIRGERLPARPVYAECGEPFFPNLVHRRVRFDVAGRFRTVILGDWKLIWTPFQTDPLTYELYDIGADPDETRNLYAAGQPGTERLKRLLHDWADTNDGASTEDDLRTLSAQDHEKLHSLGYVE